MPSKIGGGNKLQEYNPSNGRYGCGSIGYTQAYAKSQFLYDNYGSFTKEDKTSKIMPNYNKSVTPNEKFIKYSLDETSKNGKHKAIVYKKVLGYTIENYRSLKRQIHETIISGEAKLIGISKNAHGDIKYEYVIKVKGLNGNNADVVVVYGIGKNNGRPRMITNYVEKKGKQNGY